MTFSSTIVDYLGEGLAAARPALLTISPTCVGFYLATDTGALSAWNGAAWVSFASGSGTVTSIVAGAGLAGGTITASGTISLGTIAATSLFGNPTGSGAVPSALSLGSGLKITGGTTLQTAGANIRTVPFTMVGPPSNAQEMNITLTQAGTLLANGGTPQEYIPVNPTATETLVLSTIHSGTITARGTISISTSGSVTFPSFSAVPLVAGDSIQLKNQATADATFANACISLQMSVD